MEEMQTKLQKIFQANNPPTAIFAHDDYLAARTIVALQKMQLHVPDDVSIIAPGDVLDYTQPFIPKITTMRINNELMGKLAGEMLLERLKNPQEEVHVLKVNQTLIKRGSCQQLMQ
jgi:DNA-binding LacI/PurR family transcriptional regulator